MRVAKTLRYFLILALVAVAAWHLWPHLNDLKNIVQLIKNANFFWITLSAVAIAGQYFGDGWLSQILLKITDHKISLKDTLKIASIDVFAAHLFPVGEAGVIATVAYFYKKLGVSAQGIIFLVLTWGTITNIVAVLLLIISAIYLPHLPNLPIQVSAAAKILIGVIIAVSAALIFKKGILFKKLRDIFKRQKLFKEILIFFNNLSSHKEAIADNKKQILLAFLAAFIYYLANIASLYFAFLTFGSAPPVALVTFMYLLSLIVAFITLAPAGIGAVESTMVVGFLQFGVDPARAFAAILLFRLFAFWLPIPLGAYSYFSLKKAQNGEGS